MDRTRSTSQADALIDEMNHVSRLTIQDLSLKCAVPKSTIRFWEKQLEPHLTPSRSPGGQRRASPLANRPAAAMICVLRASPERAVREMEPRA